MADNNKSTEQLVADIRTELERAERQRESLRRDLKAAEQLIKRLKSAQQALRPARGPATRTVEGAAPTSGDVSEAVRSVLETLGPTPVDVLREKVGAELRQRGKTLMGFQLRFRSVLKSGEVEASAEDGTTVVRLRDAGVSGDSAGG